MLIEFKLTKKKVHDYSKSESGKHVLERVGKLKKELLVRLLGLWVDEDLKFTDHIAKMRSKLLKGIYLLSASRNNSLVRIRLNIYY